MQLCRYQLQYCAINSQMRSHKNAFTAGKKVLIIIKSIFQELKKMATNMSYHLLEIDEDIEDIQSKVKVINGVSTIEN